MKCWVDVVLVTIVAITVLLSVVQAICSTDNNHDRTVVNTSYGPVRGIKMLSKYDEKEFYSYRGIPYAKPPVGALRFKPPEPHEGWKETLDAFEFGNSCPQVVQIGATNYWGDQDCLTLNIYAPATANAAVMFFIHGGGYIDGSNNDYFYGPDFLINENVILVIPNYRLGAHGFMSLGNADISGNMGLKDMLFALKWVNDNIGKFGGDPKKITIFGHSSGGAAAHLLTLSPKSEGLFKRAIIMSGTAFNPWALGPHNNHTEYVYKLAEKMGHPTKNYDDLLKFIQASDPEELIKQSTVSYESVIEDGKLEFATPFSPVIENENEPNPVFIQEPEQYVTHKFRSKIEIMFGHTTGECLFDLASIIENPSKLKEFNEKFLFNLPRRDLLIADYDSPAHKKARAEIRNYYFGTNEINLTQLGKIIDFLSDIIYRYGIERALEAESERKGNNYYYTFNGVGDLNAFTMYANLTNLGIPRASHGDELCYLFRCTSIEQTYNELAPGSKERQMIKNIASIFANFAKNGKPKSSNRDVEWKPVKKGEMNIVELGTLTNTAQLNVLQDMKKIWDVTLYEYQKNKK